MHRRISHWATIDLICQLVQIDVSGSLADLPPPPTHMRTSLDERLAHLLRTMEPSEISAVMKHYPGGNLSSIAKLKQNSGEKDKVLYDRTTASDYHCLLCATLIAFAQALSKLSEATTSNSSAIQDYAKGVVTYAALLTTVVFSTAFEQHSQFLAMRGLLNAPKDEYRSPAGRFAKENGIVIMPEPRTRTQVDTEPRDQDEEDPLDDEHELLHHTVPLLDVYSIRSRIRVLIEHFTAGRILQHHCSKLQQNDIVNITVVVVEGPPQNLKASWEDMKKIITDLEDHRSSMLDSDQPAFELAKAIERLEEVAKNVSDDDSKAMRDLRRLITLEKPLTLNDKLHCEAILLSFIKYPDNATPDIRDLLKVLRSYLFIHSFY
jgi:hypothetical protein